MEKIENIISKLAVAVERIQKENSSLAISQERAVQVEEDSPFPGQKNLEMSLDEEFEDGNHIGSNNGRRFGESSTDTHNRNVQTKNISAAEYELYPTQIAHKIY